jgi:hypothetical protein
MAVPASRGESKLLPEAYMKRLDRLNRLDALERYLTRLLEAEILRRDAAVRILTMAYSVADILDLRPDAQKFHTGS